MKQNLKGIRANLGLSTKEFAEKTNVTEDRLYNYETGRTAPDVLFVDKVLELTNLKYEDIIFYPKNTT